MMKEQTERIVFRPNSLKRYRVGRVARTPTALTVAVITLGGRPDDTMMMLE